MTSTRKPRIPNSSPSPRLAGRKLRAATMGAVRAKIGEKLNRPTTTAEEMRIFEADLSHIESHAISKSDFKRDTDARERLDAVARLAGDPSRVFDTFASLLRVLREQSALLDAQDPPPFADMIRAAQSPAIDDLVAGFTWLSKSECWRWSSRSMFADQLHWKDRFWWLGQPRPSDLALISLLVGNFPDVDSQDELTVDSVIALEAKAIGAAMRRRKSKRRDPPV